MASQQGKFCVIGPTVGRYSSHERRWFNTYEEAAEHARTLLKGRQPGAQPAIVVEAKMIFEVEPHPIVSRKPTKSDFLAIDGAED